MRRLRLSTLLITVNVGLLLLAVTGVAWIADRLLRQAAGEQAMALATFEKELPDLVILDVNLPGPSGFDLLHRVRAQALTPVTLLTVRSGKEDEVRGLDLGADNYQTKPFSPRTLLARVPAMLRRAEGDGIAAKGEPGERALRAGDPTLDPESQAVRVGRRAAVRLTKLEFRLMQYVLVSTGHTLPAERLTQHLLGYHGAGDRQMLKPLVHRLRQKVERDPAAPEYVLTIPGAGYRLQPGVGR